MSVSSSVRSRLSRLLRLASGAADPSSSRAAVVRSSLGGVLLNGSASLLFFTISILLARSLGASDYGVYAYAISWTVVLGVFADFGLARLLVRNVASYHARAQWAHLRGQLTWALTVGLVASIGTSIAALLSIHLLRDSLPFGAVAPLSLALLILPLNCLLRGSQAALRGLHHVLPGLVVELVAQPASLLLLLCGHALLAPRTLAPTSTVALHLASISVALVLGAWLLGRHLPAEAVASRSAWLHDEWWRASRALMLLGGLHILNSRTDILMLGSLASAAETGIYSVCARGAELALLAVVPVHTALMPTVARLHARGQLAELQALVTRIARSVFAVSLPVYFVLAAFGDRFLLLYGSEYAAGSRALALLCVGQIFVLGVGPSALLLAMTGFERSAALAVGGSALANLALNSVLIPAWGIEGAATATALSAVAMAVFTTYRVRRSLSLRSDVFAPTAGAAGD